MNISLTAAQKDFVHEQLESGRYHTAAEVVREGIRLLMEQEELRAIRREELRKMIQAGLDDVAAGRLRDGEDVIAELQKKLDQRTEAGERSSKR